MLSKLKSNPSNFAFIIIIYSIIILEISKNIKIQQINSFNLLLIYGIMGLLLPLLFFKEKQKYEKLTKLSKRFAVLCCFSLSLFNQVIIYYVNKDDYFNLIERSPLNQSNLSTLTNIIIYFIFATLVYLFCNNIIYARIIKENNEIISIIMCGICFAILNNSSTFIVNFIFGVTVFSLVFALSNSKIALMYIYINAILNMIFVFIYRLYSSFDIIHYFVFFMVILSFVVFSKSLNYLESLLFYKKIKLFSLESVNKANLKVIWFIIILIGYIFVINS